MDGVAAFRTELEAAGLMPSEVVPDGVLRRCPTRDKPRDKTGWLVLYEDPLAGAFGDWQKGESRTWSCNGGDLDPEARRRIQERIEEARREREAEEARRHAEAAEEAQRILESLPDAGPETPYFKQKQVKPGPGIKEDSGTGVVPVHGPDGRIQSLQRIEADGDKQNMTGGKMAGGFFPINKGGTGRLIICEGPATGLTLQEADPAATVLVAFTAGNLRAVAEMARKRYPERPIIIAGDDDAKTEAKTGRNPGREAAEAAARAVGGKVAFPVFKAGEGSDFNDLHQAEGIEVVRRCLENSKLAKIAGHEPEKWNAPLPVTSARFGNDPYPVEALPPAIREAVEEVTRFVQAPVEMVALSALSAVSTVTAGLVDVERAAKLRGPTSLYTLAVADSGERKSTLDAFFSKAIRDWEAEKLETMGPELARYDAALSAWEARKSGLLNAIKEAEKKGKAVDELENRLEKLEARKPERPKVPRLLVGDATTEALTWRLANGWPVAGLLSSEGGLIFGAYSMGKDTVMRNLATLNSLWGAEPLSVERRTSDSFMIRSARLTVGIAVQEETVTRFIDGTRGLARGSGFLARFLVAMPETRQGRRPFKEPPENWPALARFHRRLGALLDEPLIFNIHGDLEPRTLTLSTEAKRIWIDFHNEVEAELLPGGEMAETRDVASKAADNAARLAALFHCFEIGPAGAIGNGHMTAGAVVAAWHIFEARRFMGELALPLEIANAARLDAWLLDYCKQNKVDELTTTQCLQFGPPGTRRRRWLDAALFELEDARRTRRRTEGRKVIVKVNPELLEG